MVAGAGGEVRVDSAPGKGTRFTIWFPVHEPAAVPAGGGVPAGAGDRSDVTARRTGHVVIVVDDEPEVLRLSVRELERAGYQVVGATEGSQALNALHARNGAADLLVTDVVMPGMNGIELAAAVTRRYPQIPVLFLSGHLDEEAEAARRSLPGDAELLTKPFTPDELSERVGLVIDRHAAPARHRPRGGPSHAGALPAPPAPSAAPEPATTPEPATPGAGRRRRSQGSKR
jgi:CheY-like chemotaxis protein